MLDIDSNYLFNIEKLFYENQKGIKENSFILDQIITEKTINLMEINNLIICSVIRRIFLYIVLQQSQTEQYKHCQ